MMKLSLIASLAALLILAGCAGNDEAGADNGAASDSAAGTSTAVDSGAQSVAVNVKVMTIQPEAFDDVIEVVGTVKPVEDILVASEEGGKVESWMVRKGAFVRKGQGLISLNDDILQAQLEAAKAQYNIAKVNAEKSAKVYADAGAVSEISVTTAQYNLDAAAANVRLLETRIAKMSVKAPVNGQIEERIVDVGEMVAPGAPIARLIQTGVVKVTAGVPERYVQGLRIGLPVTMTFDALNGRKVEGRITFIGAAVSERDRSVPIEIELSNAGGAYKPEMMVNLAVLKDRLRNVVVVPRTALVRIEDGYQVYLVVPSGDGYVAEARQVTLGPSDRGNVVITEGLKPGDVIIAIGQSKVNPGEKVEFDEM